MVEIKPFKGIRYNKEKIRDFSLVLTPPYDVISEEEQNRLHTLSEYNMVNLIIGKTGKTKEGSKRDNSGNKDNKKDDEDNGERDNGEKDNRERDNGEKDNRERDNGEKDNRERDNGENKYSKVALDFKEWQEKGILKKDSEDSVYVYSEEFSHNKKRFVRLAFISLVKLNEPGKDILPHEKIMEKPFNDRLALLEAVKSNLELIFAVYDDRKKIVERLIKGEIANKQPDMEFEDRLIEDELKVRHKLWRISDSSFIDRLKKEMEPYQCIIADGHHRYNSVLRFRKNHPELKDAGYTMCCFVNSFNDGVLILPTDRFVYNLQDVSIDKVLAGLKRNFEIDEMDDVHKLIERLENTEIMIDKRINLKNHVFGMYCFLNKKSYFLKLKEFGDKAEDCNYSPDGFNGSSNVYEKLDVNILHKLVFEEVLGISEEEQLKGNYIEYAKGSKRALEKLKDNKYQFAFFINAPLMREIFLTARAGRTMPQKSTYFYPKVYSGLVINKFGDSQ